MGRDAKIFLPAESFLSIRFVFSAAILVLAATALRPGLGALSRRYTKQPIKINKSLTEFDILRLPSFKRGWSISHVPPDDIETDEYAIIRLTREGSQTEPREVVLFATYYSDPKSKVPHTADVCYRQGGAVVEEIRNIAIDIPDLAEDSQVTARLLLLRQQNYNQVVIYCFCADGEFKHSREQVRWMIGKPGNRYVYFSKIEAIASYPTGVEPGPAIELCRLLFREAAAILVSEHFPRREQLKGP